MRDGGTHVRSGFNLLERSERLVHLRGVSQWVHTWRRQHLRRHQRVRHQQRRLRPAHVVREHRRICTCGACPTGFTGTGYTSCTDVDECKSNNGGCDPQAQCTNTPGSRTCGDCAPGYTQSANGACVDINECDTDNGGCDARSQCTNTAGSRTCGACPSGFTGSGYTQCNDINECLDGQNGGCNPSLICHNTVGSRTCEAVRPAIAPRTVPASTSMNVRRTTAGAIRIRRVRISTDRGRADPCAAGYTGTGFTGCNDINECLDGQNGGCDPTLQCKNTPGSRTCEACPSGYRGENGACVDVNECESGAVRAAPTRSAVTRRAGMTARPVRRASARRATNALKSTSAKQTMVGAIRS